MAKITIKSIAILAMGFAFLSNVAQAEGFLKSGPSVFNYDYADLVYIDDDGADGFGLRFSADFNDNLAFQVGYAMLDAGRFDADTLSAGVAYHIQTASFPEADWVFDAGIQSTDVEIDDDTGLYLGAGIRYGINEAFEVQGALSLNTTFDTDLAINLRGLYEVATGFSALVETSLGDNSAIGIGVRFYWR